jgi:acetylornithine deacetylase/succinyl-diaminopimelate desuccinylase-like protein
MKAGIASTLTALKKFKHTKGVTLTLECDEEYYFKGIKKLLKEYKFNPKLVICPEPTNLKIISGCRGLIEIKLSILGKTAHAGNPQAGINAIEKTVRIIE